MDIGLRFLVARSDLRRTRISPDQDGPHARPLVDGEVRLAIDAFALTANNITYAAFGQTMHYWDFFPADDPDWGCIPVWGFADVCESRTPDVPVGRRIYGYLPMASHLVVRPRPGGVRGFTDAATHRASLPAVYNQYTFCDADPAYRRELEPQQALLRPLFATAFLIDDHLAQQDYFGAHQLVLSSASSKTAYATAHCLSRRRPAAKVPRIIGLTSPVHLDFVRSLGCFDEALDYQGVASLVGDAASVYIDFSGSADIRRRVHEHLGDRLRQSIAVGGTHWEQLGSGAGLPGPRPVLFFAPAQMKQRSEPPPAGWGRDGLQQRLDDAWRSFMAPVCDALHPWLSVDHAEGAPAVEAAYRGLLDGRTSPDRGLMLRL